MAAITAPPNRRCVFVGNIPYDATEEQLIQICEEAGPVVSFRLVNDRETGKPKGYGFCEYKDEETALSAIRNLQGYEVNGRQLRVDFAENNKNNADRTREQGRGGPGTVTTIDPSKQFAVPATPRDHSLLQPLGVPIAMAAATVMAGALGSAQAASTNMVGLQNQTPLGTDSLTQYLAKMSSSQLTEILSELKVLITQDKDKARMLLLAIPTLPKALFQAQIMLGMVTPQTLQMPNILQSSTQPVQPLKQSVQANTGLPPLPQNKMQFGSLTQAHEIPGPAGVSNSNPYATALSLPIPSQIQHPQLAQNQILQQGQVLVRPGVSSLPAVHPESLVGLPVRSHTQAPTSSLLNQQFQPPLSQNIGQVPSVKSTYHGHPGTQNSNTLSAVMRPQFSSESYQPPSLISSALPQNMDLKRHVLPGNTSMASDQMNRPSKMMKLNDGRVPPSLKADSAPISVPPQTSAPLGRQTSMAQETLNSPGRQDNKLQLPSNVDSTLLQQVLNLTPEQLNSLPPDQQQQVIELQQMLRQAA